MTIIKLTPAETAIVKVLHEIDHMSDGPMEADFSGVWGGCITDRIRLMSKSMAGSRGILSSLVQKGVLRPEGDIEEDGHWMLLTPNGLDTWRSLQNEEGEPQEAYISASLHHANENNVWVYVASSGSDDHGETERLILQESRRIAVSRLGAAVRLSDLDSARSVGESHTTVHYILMP
jgi:hypothetical protein